MQVDQLKAAKPFSKFFFDNLYKHEGDRSLMVFSCIVDYTPNFTFVAPNIAPSFVSIHSENEEEKGQTERLTKLSFRER